MIRRLFASLQHLMHQQQQQHRNINGTKFSPPGMARNQPALDPRMLFARGGHRFPFFPRQRHYSDTLEHKSGVERYPPRVAMSAPEHGAMEHLPKDFHRFMHGPHNIHGPHGNIHGPHRNFHSFPEDFLPPELANVPPAVLAAQFAKYPMGFPPFPPPGSPPFGPDGFDFFPPFDPYFGRMPPFMGNEMFFDMMPPHFYGMPPFFPGFKPPR